MFADTLRNKKRNKNKIMKYKYIEQENMILTYEIRMSD